MEDVLSIGEGFMRRVFKEILDIEIGDIPRLKFTDAMEQYGSDKPDIRFDMKIKDISDIVENCGFGVFSSAIESGGTVRAIVAKNSADILTRKEIDK